MIGKSTVTNKRPQSREPSRTIDSLGPSRDESGSSHLLQKGRMTNATTNFVFVNEANHCPRFKALNRYKIRSQARSHGAILKQRHETKRKTESSKLKLLAPQGRGHGGSQFLPHDNSCPLTIRERRTLTESDSKPLDHHENLEAYCKVCRAKSGSIGTKTRQPLNGSPPSPRGLFGAGRVDPFLSYPTEMQDPDIPELVDLQINYVLPGILPNYNPHELNSINSVAKAWLSACVGNPFLFNVFMWSTCIKRNFIRGSREYCNSAQALTYKVVGIQQLNKVISNGKKALTDEVIIAIAGLAAHEVVNVTEEKIKPLNSPLQSAGLLDVYGGMQVVPEHRDAILKLVALRGGIENLTLPGLAEEICEVINSSFTRKSVFPPMRFHEPYIAAVKEWATTSAASPVQTLGKLFRQLPECGITETMLEVLDRIKAITKAIDHYLQGKPGGLTLGQIVRTRTGIQKRLLVLPTAKELNINIKVSSCPNLYEYCRLTAIIFSIAVIYPIPNTYDVLQTLVRELRTSLKAMDIESLSADYSGVLLWMLVLGGIAALGKPERPWFVSKLAYMGVKRLKLDWDGVEDILKNFLWLESACSPGGRWLRREVMSFAV